MATPKQAPVGPPPRHKMALLTWSGAWALITLILWGLGPLMAAWPLLLRTLVISVMMVVALTWVVIPYLTRTFAGWLSPTPSSEQGERRDHGRNRPARELSLAR